MSGEAEFQLRSVGQGQEWLFGILKNSTHSELVPGMSTYVLAMLPPVQRKDCKRQEGGHTGQGATGRLEGNNCCGLFVNCRFCISPNILLWKSFKYTEN